MPDPENNHDADRQGFQQGVVAPERGSLAIAVPVGFERDLGASRHQQVGFGLAPGIEEIATVNHRRRQGAATDQRAGAWPPWREGQAPGDEAL